MSETKKPRKKPVYRKPLQKKEWAEIAALWSLGEARLADLARKFKVAPETVSRKMKKMGVKYGESAAEHTKKVQKKVEEAAVTDASVVAERIRETKEEHYRNSRALAAAAMRVLTTAQKSKHPLATAEPDLKAIERAIKIQDSALRQRWMVLGLDKIDSDDGDLPDLMIREMTEGEIDKIKADSEQMAAGVGDVGNLGEFDMDDDPLADVDG